MYIEYKTKAEKEAKKKEGLECVRRIMAAWSRDYCLDPNGNIVKKPFLTLIKGGRHE